MTSKLVALTMAVTFGASAEMTDADERHYQCISDYSLFRPWVGSNRIQNHNIDCLVQRL